MITKKCSKCKRDLTLDNFCKDVHRKDNLRNYCRECESKRKKEYMARKYGETISNNSLRKSA